MSLNKIFRIFGYFVSAILFFFGIILVTGIHLYAGLNTIPDNPRIVFGIVFLLYGIYRGLRLFFSNKEQEENDNDDADKKKI
jgi:hypothetical protein